MPLPLAYTQLLSFWPVDNNDPYTLSAPSPWQPVNLPSGPSPQQPTIALRFSRAINQSVYDSDSALGSYLVLTSLTHPGAVNVNSYINVAWNAVDNVLTCNPSVALNPGDTYQAILFSTLPDAQGRQLQQTYSWSFQVNPSTSSPVPNPCPLTPINSTVVLSVPELVWSIPSSYAGAPSGTGLFFTANLYSDKNLTENIWSAVIAEATGSVFGVQGSDYNTFGVTPFIGVSGLINAALYYWTVGAFYADPSGNVLAVSNTSPPSDFFLDVPPIGVSALGATLGQATYSELRTVPIMSSPLNFEVTGISPQPGGLQQVQTTDGYSFPLIAVAFSQPLNVLQLNI